MGNSLHWSLCGSWRLSEGSWSAWGLKFMWEVLAVWRELKYLRPMFIWEVVAEQWRCWVWGLKFMWELMGVWRELAAMWLKVCGGAGGYVQGAGGYVNKPKIGYSSGLNWTFLTFTWPAPDLDLDPDLSLTKERRESKNLNFETNRWMDIFIPWALVRANKNIYHTIKDLWDQICGNLNARE